jgi:D-erythronate 2-dehydrogenase
VKTWPGRIEARRARGLGLSPDASFEDVIRDYVRENPDAVKLPTKA